MNEPASSCRIGTRGSDLALWQARTVAGLLADHGVAAEITVIKTRGDRIDDVPFSQLEGKGFFTKELEEAQLERRIDLAVHSLKDLATSMPAELDLIALVGREDPRELLLARPDAVDPEREAQDEVLPLRSGAVVGTSAARRQAQIRHLRPDLRIADLRGNVPTRVRRLREGRYDAVLLARAGLVRLGLETADLWTKPLAVASFVPAPGQGMLGIQCRRGDAWAPLLARLHCAEAARGATAERCLLERLNGGCQLPFGVNVGQQDGAWHLVAFLAATAEDPHPIRCALMGDDPDTLAEEAWTRLRRARNHANAESNDS